MTDQTPDLTEPDNPAAYALARHIADHPVSTIQAAFRYLNAPLGIELHDPGAVVPSAVPAPATDRAALSARLWAIAWHHIVAEWICCEPLDPEHDLCAKGYEALRMVKTLFVDSDPEEAWNPAAPLLDVVLAEIQGASSAAAQPEPAADREGMREQIAEALATDDGHPWDTLCGDTQRHYLDNADAVLAVLPASVDRATVQHEAADAVAALDRRKLRILASLDGEAWEEGRDEAEALLRRLAVEARDGQTTQGETGLLCVCGAPAIRDGDRWTHQPDAGDTCMYRPDARPRCPDCQMPHVITPGMQLACASILASIRDRDAAGPAGGAQQPEPVVTVHAAPDLSPAAQEALGALVEVAKRQIIEEQRP